MEADAIWRENPLQVLNAEEIKSCVEDVRRERTRRVF
jgi:Cu2+-containing amine oxidase